jgi:hypothetical protein
MYPAAPGWLVAVSLIYPAFYTVLSLRLGGRRSVVAKDLELPANHANRRE